LEKLKYYRIQIENLNSSLTALAFSFVQLSAFVASWPQKDHSCSERWSACSDSYRSNRRCHAYGCRYHKKI